MRALKLFNKKLTGDEAVSRTVRLALYDRYGAMAYGVITQIIHDQEVANAVLIDVFATPGIASLSDSPTRTACAIVRMARLKALEKESAESVLSTDFDHLPGFNGDLPKLIFDLSFTKGFTLETIAERLEMTYLDVLKAIRDYIESIRTH